MDLRIGPHTVQVRAGDAVAGIGLLAGMAVGWEDGGQVLEFLPHAGTGIWTSDLTGESWGVTEREDDWVPLDPETLDPLPAAEFVRSIGLRPELQPVIRPQPGLVSERVRVGAYGRRTGLIDGTPRRGCGLHRGIPVEWDADGDRGDVLRVRMPGDTWADSTGSRTWVVDPDGLGWTFCADPGMPKVEPN